MILYTVMPLELVMETAQSPSQQIVDSTYLGRQVVASVDGSGTRRMVRLLSTDPQDFLDPRFFPGAVIEG